MIVAATEFFSHPAEALPQQVEDAFFSSIKNPNNTFKCTWGGRFGALDGRLVEAVKARGLDVREVLDVGVSSGTTTLDLCDAFAREGYRPRITGTDHAIHAWIVPLGKRCAALLNPEGQLLQVDLSGRSIQPWRRRLDYLTGMWLVRPILSRIVGGLAARRLREGVGVRKVELVSPRVRNHGLITIVEDDVLAPRDGFGRRFDLVRAANILNENYFAEADLRKAVDNLRSYLKGPGSLLFIVRTRVSGDHHGTLFAMSDSGALEVVERIGAGSEIEKLLTAM
ncbi:ATP-binding protein [Sphingobium sp. TomTYG75]